MYLDTPKATGSAPGKRGGRKRIANTGDSNFGRGEFAKEAETEERDLRRWKPLALATPAARDDAARLARMYLDVDKKGNGRGITNTGDPKFGRGGVGDLLAADLAGAAVEAEQGTLPPPRAARRAGRLRLAGDAALPAEALLGRHLVALRLPAARTLAVNEGGAGRAEGTREGIRVDRGRTQIG